MKDKIVIGSRESRLAVIQSQMVLDFIKAHHPALDVELLTMKTTGDIILDRTLDKVGGKGDFFDFNGAKIRHPFQNIGISIAEHR